MGEILRTVDDLGIEGLDVRTEGLGFIGNNPRNDFVVVSVRSGLSDDKDAIVSSYTCAVNQQVPSARTQSTITLVHRHLPFSPNHRAPNRLYFFLGYRADEGVPFEERSYTLCSRAAI